MKKASFGALQNSIALNLELKYEINMGPRRRVNNLLSQDSPMHQTHFDRVQVRDRGRKHFWEGPEFTDPIAL